MPTHQLLNTLYVTTERSYLRLDHETLRVEAEGEKLLQIPLHHLGAIVCFGDVMISPSLLGRCAEDGRCVVFLTSSGRFRCRMEGPVSGNVLLRRAQHQALNEPARTAAIARSIVAGKIQNCRQILMRGAREATDDCEAGQLRESAETMCRILPRVAEVTDLDAIRGFEGEAAHLYFQSLSLLVREDRASFGISKRVRRPPTDCLNALLSFLYSILLNDCVAAAEGVGLDPQVGFLHTLRSGRPGLGLDLMEELRPILADRLALTLINRKQLSARDFVERPGGAVHLDDDGRKELLIAYQKRKQDEVLHPVLRRTVPLGLVPHVQARLLARHLRGDLDSYTPFLYR